MNPFEDLQSYQQPTQSVGPALTGQPTQAQAQGMGPPASQEEYQQRVQGWTSALGELIRQPEVAVALLQMGTAFGSGRSGSEAVAEGLGAAGRASGIREKMRQQGLAEEQLGWKRGMEEKKYGLEERELAGREELQKAQIANYQRMARGGGGGGGGSKADMDAVTARWEKLYQWRLGKNGGDKAEAEAFADSTTFGNSKLPKPEPALTPTLLLQEAERQNNEAVRLFEMGDTKGAAAAKAEAQRLRQQAGISTRTAEGPSVEDRILAGLEKGGAFGAPAPKRELPATIQKTMPATQAAPRPSAESSKRAIGIMAGGLPPDIAEKVRLGKPLTPQEQILLQEAQAAQRAQSMSH